MKHILLDPDWSQCGNWDEGDEFVVSAMESSCNDCRAKVMVGPTKVWPVKAFPLYVPEPHQDAETALEEMQRVRDGK